MPCTLLHAEHVSGLFIGIAYPLFASVPLNGLIFSLNDFLKSQLHAEKAAGLTLTQIYIAGACSGVVSSLVAAPTELVKAHQQSTVVPASNKLVTAFTISQKPSTASEVAHLMFKDHGIRGPYRGITATALRDTAFGVYFVTSDAAILRYFAPSPLPSNHSAELISEAGSRALSHSWHVQMLSGGIAGVTSWLAIYPFDVIRTHIQSTHSTEGDKPFGLTWSTFRKIYSLGDPNVFYWGLAPALVRAFLVNMIALPTERAVEKSFS
ncbi:mitochondrial carrier domain-containing protein [Sparassis latifolia]